MTRKHITLVLGGARSGKSGLAERLTEHTRLPKTYIATAEPRDQEMRVRIAEHQSRRGDDWRTVDAPLDLAAALRRVPPGQVCLVDCLTLWATNRMLAGHDPDKDSDDLIAAIDENQSDLILVSNEVGMGLVPDTPMGRRFRDIQGLLNQAVARRADTVLFVAAGLPLALKGTLPEGMA